MQINTAGMTPQQLQAALEQLQHEASRVSAKEDALKSMDSALQDRLQAERIGPGRPWVRPGDASDAYPLKWVVQHGGKFFISRVRVNEFEPGTSDAWEYLDPDCEEYRRKYRDEGDEDEANTPGPEEDDEEPVDPDEVES